MPLRLERLSVVDQVAATLRRGILSGEWQGWLPGERRLCVEFHVGRNTLRAALKGLAKEGILEIVPGQGTRILRETAKGSPRKEASIGLLSPEPLELLFPRQVLWIDDLRGQLAERGCLLKILHGQQYFRANPGSALRRLVDQEKCGCWILVFSNKAAQQWFEDNGITCLIAGSSHEGIHLPFVDLDYLALCRHAATSLLRLGHKRIVFLTTPPEAAGDIFSEQGFLEGIRSFSRKQKVEGRILHHGSSVQGITHMVRRLMLEADPPTAMLLSNSFIYLSVFSTLSQMGYRIPRDVSLVCRESETFLSYLEPSPACYVQSPHQFAGKVSRIADKLLRQGAVEVTSVKIMPEFEKGASIAKPGRQGSSDTSGVEKPGNRST